MTAISAINSEIEGTADNVLETEIKENEEITPTETHEELKVQLEKQDGTNDTAGAETKMIDYQDQVLEYLKKQETYFLEEHEDIPELEEEVTDPTETIQETARHLLMQLLSDVNNITSFKEAYEEEKKLNNQFELFDLSKILPSFCINDEVMEQLAFREILVIGKVDENGHVDPVGGMNLDVQTAQGSKWDGPTKIPDFTKALMDACANIQEKLAKGLKPPTDEQKDLEEYMEFLDEEMKKTQKKLLVHLSTQFNVDGNNAGSRMTSWVDRNLHTLEEKRREYIRLGEKDENLDQKQLFVYIGKRHYDIKTQPERYVCRKHCYSFRRAKTFVGEGANFILMRYLAITKYIGEFEMSALHIDGGLCRNIYQCDGPSAGIINDETMDLCKIHRTVVEECGVVHRSCTLLSIDGRIMKHDWEGCDYVLQIYPNISPRKKQLTSILHYEENWRHDLQLFSQYLDKKLSLKYQMRSYLVDHKEIENLIKDYIQNILQIKPEDIIHFTKQFFLSYAPYVLPRTEYFEEEINKCFFND